MRNKFDEQLAKLHDELSEMGQMCEEAIADAVRIFAENDKSLIEKTLMTDSEIDRKERQIESLCMELLMRQQPVARDLREISSALKMISDMERIGDQAADIAEITRHMTAVTDKCKDHVQKMAAEAISMVKDSVTSFINKDLELAWRVMAYDDVVDEWFDKMREELINAVKTDSEESSYYIDLLMICKYLERIGDHATNIAEWVEYSITGVHSKDGQKQQG